MHQFLLCTSLLIACMANAQEYADMTIDGLFNQAVDAHPSEYMEIRSTIFQKVSVPADFQRLIDAQESPVYAAMAQAMQQRYKSPDTYAHYDDLLEYMEKVAAGNPGNRDYKSNMFVKLKRLAELHSRGESTPDVQPTPYGVIEAPKERELYFILNKPEYAHFWVEASLKNINICHRVYALTRLVGFDAPFSQQTVLEVVKNDAEVSVQTYAVDLINDPKYLPFLYEELNERNTSEKREKQFQIVLEERKSRAHQTGREGPQPFGVDAREQMRREKIMYFFYLDSAIIRAFKRMDYVDSIDLLKRIYINPDANPDMREEILQAFAEFKDPNTLPFLRQEFEKQPNSDIARTIGSIDMDAYLNYLESNNTNERFMCVMAALFLDDERMIEPMARIAMNDGRSDIRRQALDRIANDFIFQDTIKPFQSLLTEEWPPEIRQAAVTAIGHNGLREGVEVLKTTVLNDPNSQVRMAAIKAFEDLIFPETVDFLEQYEAQTAGDELLMLQQVKNKVESKLERLKHEEKARRSKERNTN